MVCGLNVGIMRGRDYILLLISTILLVLSFPRFDLEYLAWVALVPLFLAIEKKPAGEAGRLSFCSGFIFWLVLLFWLRLVTAIGLVLLAGYLAIYFFLWASGIKFIQKKTNVSLVIISPVLWVSLEWLRGWLFTGFPWLPLGNSQYLNLPLIQMAAITGVYGLSFLIVAVNAVLAEIFLQIKKGGIPGLKTQWVNFSIIVFICLICFGYGKKVLGEDEGIQGTLDVAVIQGNIAQGIKWDVAYEDYNREVFQSLTEEAASNRPDLIVWPETAVTVSLPQDLEWHNTLSFLAEASGSFLLTGSLYYSTGGNEYFNSAFLISPQGEIVNRYDKIHLVPFGEYVPRKDYFPWFFERVFHEVSDYTPGREEVIFKIPAGNFNVLICFEDVFPNMVRQFVKKGSELLINITNDVWFGKSSAPFQHLAMGALRAVENHRYLVCCANTGISAFISPRGEILGRVEDNSGCPLWVRGFLIQKVGMLGKLTFYTRFGDWFVYLNLLGSGLFLILSFIKIGGKNERRIRK